MDSFESVEGQITELQQMLAAEENEGLRSWFLHEYELSQEGQELRRNLLNGLALGLNQVVEAQVLQPTTEEAREVSKEDHTDNNGLIEEILEQPNILSPKEILYKRIEKKYQVCLEQYDTEVDYIANTTRKASKRDHQQRLARRQFARSFCDFSNTTGDDHIILKAELLTWVADNLFEDDDLLDEVFSNAADYAERHGKEVTADHVNFAHIIANAAKDRPYERDYDAVLRSIFSSRHNRADFTAIYSNLAESSYELLEDTGALTKIVKTVDYKTRAIAAVRVEIFRSLIRAILTNDLQGAIEISESEKIFSQLSNDVVGFAWSPWDEKALLGVALQGLERAERDMVQELSLSTDKSLGNAINEAGRFLSEGCFDPVYITELDGNGEIEVSPFASQETPNDLSHALFSSSMFRKRMQHFAPYAYAIKAAKTILGGGVHGLLIPLSPSLTVDTYIPYGKSNIRTDDDMDRMTHIANLFLPRILAAATEGINKIGVSSFEESGELAMKYIDVAKGKPKQGVIIIRPNIPLDNRVHHALQLLTVNHERASVKCERETGLPLSKEVFETDNARLRTEIRHGQKRFLGRRPIKFVMPQDLRQNGLNAVNLRYDPKTTTVKATLRLEDGEVELNLDRNFSIDMTGAISGTKHDEMKPYYENLLLKLAKEWACANEVHTSEGLVSQASGNTANMGHFAYLRISDGKKYRYSELQNDACKEEQGLDLAEENERLSALDPTGQSRNSTYVRENYDPNKPPLEVYFPSLD